MSDVKLIDIHGLVAAASSGHTHRRRRIRSAGIEQSWNKFHFDQNITHKLQKSCRNKTKRKKIWIQNPEFWFRKKYLRPRRHCERCQPCCWGNGGLTGAQHADSRDLVRNEKCFKIWRLSQRKNAKKAAHDQIVMILFLYQTVDALGALRLDRVPQETRKDNATD